MIGKGAALGPRDSAVHRYRIANGGEPVVMVAHLKYFAPWDWVIGVVLPEREERETAARIAGMFTRGKWIVVGAVLVGLAGSAAAWFLIAGKLSGSSPNW